MVVCICNSSYGEAEIGTHKHESVLVYAHMYITHTSTHTRVHSSTQRNERNVPETSSALIIFTRYFWNLIITSLSDDIFVFFLNWEILPLYNKFVSNLIACVITKADIYGDLKVLCTALISSMC